MREPEAQRLARVLGPFDATMVVLGGIVGVGIFFTPADVARRAPDSAWILAAWVAGGGIALFGALTFASLARNLPRAGGTYAYLRAAFGPLAGFLFAWASLLTINTGAMAIIGSVAAENILRLGGGIPSPHAVRWGAAAAVALLTAVNAFGVRQGAWTQNLLTVVKTAAIVGLAALGLILLPHPREAPDAPGAQAIGLSAFCLALLPVLFSYGGWQNACFLAEEVERPERNVPLAVICGTLAAVVIYVAFNSALLRQLGAGGMAGAQAVGFELAGKTLPPWGGAAASAAVAISALGVLNGMILGTPRILYAAARDGLFFRSCARLEPRSAVPLRVLLLQAGVSLVYIFVAELREILDGLVVVDWLFFTLAALSWFVLSGRRRSAAALVPGLFAISAAAILCGALWESIADAGKRRTAAMAMVQLGILAVGALVYAVWARPKRPRRTDDSG